MGIFLLCIPLVIFIVAEGVILYFLTDMIIQALNDYGYSSTTMVDNVFPALNAILYVFLLMTAIAVAIYLYIRFAVKPALNKNKNKNKKKNPERGNVFGIYSKNSNGLNGNFNNTAIMGNPNFSNFNNGENFNADIEMNDAPDNTGKKKSNKKIKNRRKKKSKKTLIIIIAVVAVIIGAAAYLFIFQRDLIMPIMPFLFGEESTTEAVESKASDDTTEAVTETNTESIGETSDNNTPIDDNTDEITTEMPDEPPSAEETT